jgi:UDP-2,3-diacylglucosamine hydrolase
MPSGPTLFISDLHLTPERPTQARLFRDFMQQKTPDCTALYILGDFFESWVGDDDLSLAFNADIAAHVRKRVDSGVPVFFMCGNRDFLAGPTLAQATGWTHLPDPTLVQLYGTPTLISHGDAYCTDDLAYQAFRGRVRDPAWQAAFLAKPLAERHAVAQAIREQSEQAKAGKQKTIMDVNSGAIRHALLEAGAVRLIHGHTHRPAKHLLEINGKTCARWVLADWYESGGYLTCNEKGCQLAAFP